MWSGDLRRISAASTRQDQDGTAVVTSDHEGALFMKTGIRELRDGLSRHLARIRRGEEITITDRGRDLAVIRPLRSRGTLEQIVAGLCEEGVLEPAEPWEPLRPRRHRLKGRLLSALVLEERARGW